MTFYRVTLPVKLIIYGAAVLAGVAALKGAVDVAVLSGIVCYVYQKHGDLAVRMRTARDRIAHLEGLARVQEDLIKEQATYIEVMRTNHSILLTEHLAARAHYAQQMERAQSIVGQAEMIRSGRG